jgi:hypothetical protein
MADTYEREPGDSPGRFINRVGDGIRSELEQTYAQRLVEARQQMREEQDRAEADRICADVSLRTQRMAEYRRGRWYQLGASPRARPAGSRPASSPSARPTCARSACRSWPSPACPA